MSIFKATLKPYVRRQINARQNLLGSQGSRPIDLQMYTSAKMPWLKMSSLVDYTGKIGRNSYAGMDLSKKYVLQGGTLYPDPSDPKNSKFSLRSGVGHASSAYGGNLGNRDFGMRPMPGITEAEIKTLSAYGSLRQATVKFYAWDKQQLDELEILFMRPGFFVLLEWGWSMYLDTYNKATDESDADPASPLTNNDNPSKTDIKTFEGLTINPFTETINQDVIYKKLQDYQKKYAGNYDGMLGIVKNFQWEMLDNGGYECTTTLISIGDIIDSLRMNSSTGIEDKSNQTGVASDKPQSPKTPFEIYMGYFIDNNPSISDVSSKAEQEYPGLLDTSITKITYSSGDTKSELSYMQLAYFIYFLNKKFTLYNGNRSLFTIEIPLTDPLLKDNLGSGYCLATRNSISIRPEVCVLKNSKATFLNLVTPAADLFSIAQSKVVFSAGGLYDNSSPDNSSVKSSTPTLSPGTVKREYILDEDNSIGIIGNVYICIEHMLERYAQMLDKDSNTVNMAKFLQQILGDISDSIGSINDFGLYVTDNRIVLVDKHYVEPSKATASSTKFTMNVVGADSMVRTQKIVSKIFDSQATMIAIGAQNRENVASVQSSTNSYLNRNMQNRVYNGEPIDFAGIERDELAKKINIKANNIVSFASYLNKQFVAAPLLPKQIPPAVGSLLTDVLLQLDYEANYRVIIPVSVSLTVDGLSGLTIGEMFRINSNILPIGYQNSNVGFIITGLQNNIKRSDWTTVITAMVCLLDHTDASLGNGKYGSLYKKSDEYDKLVEEVNSVIIDKENKSNNNADYYNIILDFIQKYFNNSLTIRVVNTESFQGTSGISYDTKPIFINDNTRNINISMANFIADINTFIKSTFIIGNHFDINNKKIVLVNPPYEEKNGNGYIKYRNINIPILDSVNNDYDPVMTNIERMIIETETYKNLDPEIKDRLNNDFNTLHQNLKVTILYHINDITFSNSGDILSLDSSVNPMVINVPFNKFKNANTNPFDTGTFF